jgi:hypothetical protein
MIQRYEVDTLGESDEQYLFVTQLWKGHNNGAAGAK